MQRKLPGNHTPSKIFLYTIKNQDVESLIQTGTQKFKQFIELKKSDAKAAQDSLSESLALFNSAINQSDTPLDKAFCHRKYASTIIRNSEITPQVAYTDAITHLQAAELIFEDHLKENSDDPVIITEYQRTLAYLCHAALELNNGPLLEAAATKLFTATEKLKNADFRIDALNYLYHVALSKNDLIHAEGHTRKSIELQEIQKKNIYTEYRHLAKINLLHLHQKLSKPNNNDGFDKKLFLERRVRNIFWTCFDGHKKEYQAIKNQQTLFNKDFSAINKALLKDFCFFLQLKIVERLHNLDDNKRNETIYDYMTRQVKNVYNQHQQGEFVLTTFKKIINEIKEKKQMDFAYPLFGGLAPSIAVSAENFDRLFPNWVNFPAISHPDNTSRSSNNNNY